VASVILARRILAGAIDVETRRMDKRLTMANLAAAAALAAMILCGHGPASAQDKAQGTPNAAADEPVPTFDAAYLGNTANIELGQGVWAKQCRHCHGNSACPGKSPKLRPGGMEPDFIFDRVTNGFRGMPAWKAVFTLEERTGVVAYVKSDSFSP
jgi:mono/diheme cytochrome c family protein